MPSLRARLRDLLVWLVTAAGLVASASSSCIHLPTTATLTDVALGAEDLVVDVTMRIDKVPAPWDLDDTATQALAFVTVETDAAGAAVPTRLTLSLFALDDGRQEMGEDELPPFEDIDDGIDGNFVASASVGGGFALVECGGYPCESKLELVLDIEAPADFAALADVSVDALNDVIRPPSLVVELQQAPAE